MAKSGSLETAKVETGISDIMDVASDVGMVGLGGPRPRMRIKRSDRPCLEAEEAATIRNDKRG